MTPRRKPSLPNTRDLRWCQENIPELRNADLYEAGDILADRLLRRALRSKAGNL
jgi:hypothetical protein